MLWQGGRQGPCDFVGSGIKRLMYLLLLIDNLKEMAELVFLVLQKSRWDGKVPN